MVLFLLYRIVIVIVIVVVIVVVIVIVIVNQDCSIHNLHDCSCYLYCYCNCYWYWYLYCYHYCYCCHCLYCYCYCQSGLSYSWSTCQRLPPPGVYLETWLQACVWIPSVMDRLVFSSIWSGSSTSSISCIPSTSSNIINAWRPGSRHVCGLPLWWTG